jgi:hypothetical protein
VSPSLDIGPKTVDELLERIIEQVESAEKGEPPSMF